MVGRYKNMSIKTTAVVSKKDREAKRQSAEGF